jgi:hypothetical protein
MGSETTGLRAKVKAPFSLPSRKTFRSEIIYPVNREQQIIKTEELGKIGEILQLNAHLKVV